MSKISLIVAMNKELEIYAGLMPDFENVIYNQRTFLCGKLHNHDLFIAVSGIGKVNAALCAADLITFARPDYLINIGISGGLNSALHIGDFVIGSDIVYHDVWCGKPNAYGQIQDFPALYHSSPELSSKLDFIQGLICCGDKFITDTAELNAIVAKFPVALAVDMESAALAQTCHIYNIPFLSIRQISDTPGAHQAEQYQNFWNNAPQNSVNTIRNILEKL